MLLWQRDRKRERESTRRLWDKLHAEFLTRRLAAETHRGGRGGSGGFFVSEGRSVESPLLSRERDEFRVKASLFENCRAPCTWLATFYADLLPLRAGNPRRWCKWDWASRDYSCNFRGGRWCFWIYYDATTKRSEMFVHGDVTGMKAKE